MCRLYSGISWKYKIIVIDRWFLSQRVNELKNWNIDFIQAGILDKKLLKNILIDEDIVRHLVGITDVAYVHNDINLERDKKIE